MPTATPNVDLTFDGASGTINGGVFMTGTFQAGPTTFSSFLEVRHNGTEQGYNTNGTLQYDTLDGQNSTHSILLANVPIVIGDGTKEHRQASLTANSVSVSAKPAPPSSCCRWTPCRSGRKN